MSRRAQQLLLIWTVVLASGYVLALAFLLDMIPPPPATWSPEQVADWYAERHTRIRFGAVLASFTSAFTVPLAVVIATQMRRIEKGRPVWTMTAFAGAIMTSILLVLPPLFWGVAAYTPSRDPQSTALMHELGVLTFITGVQYFLFLFGGVIVICFRSPAVVHSPFPRWFAYYTVWSALMFEAGPIAFLTKTGPFAWNGLLAFWAPFVLVVAWLSVMVALLANALRHQTEAKPPTVAEGTWPPMVWGIGGS